MIAASNLQKQILQALHDVLIPWLDTDAGNDILLAEPPLAATNRIKIAYKAAPPLREQTKGGGVIRNRMWKKEALNSSAAPLLLFVLDGEADIRLATTAGMLARRPSTVNRCGKYTVSLPGVSCLLVPPGVPISDASRPHWERDRLENARSSIMWLRVLSEAGFCHLCHTRGSEHISSNCLLANDNQLPHLVELIFGEMREQKRSYLDVSRSLLRTLLLRVERNLDERAVVASHEEQSLAGGTASEYGASASTVSTLELACRYINSHLGLPLSPASVAAHAYISTAQLKRVFRAEMNLTVMEYVKNRRLEAARFLLEHTDMPIREVAQQVGYLQPAHFSSSFSQAEAMSPREFRALSRVREQS